MKNNFRLFAVAILAAAIGFSMTGCATATLRPADHLLSGETFNLRFQARCMQHHGWVTVFDGDVPLFTGTLPMNGGYWTVIYGIRGGTELTVIVTINAWYELMYEQDWIPSGPTRSPVAGYRFLRYTTNVDMENTANWAHLLDNDSADWIFLYGEHDRTMSDARTTNGIFRFRITGDTQVNVGWADIPIQ